jgi:hypothetical protein
VHPCRCGPLLVERCLACISGPLLDRIDMHLQMPAVRYTDLAATRGAESSAVIRVRVEAARARRRERFRGRSGLFANAHMSSREVRRHCAVDQEIGEILRAAVERLGLSARGCHQVLKLARTIADLAGRRRSARRNCGRRTRIGAWIGDGRGDLERQGYLEHVLSKRLPKDCGGLCDVQDSAVPEFVGHASTGLAECRVSSIVRLPLRSPSKENLGQQLSRVTAGVRQVTEEWLTIYNTERPHDSLGGVPPCTYLPRRVYKRDQRHAA